MSINTGITLERQYDNWLASYSAPIDLLPWITNTTFTDRPIQVHLPEEKLKLHVSVESSTSLRNKGGFGLEPQHRQQDKPPGRTQISVGERTSKLGNEKPCIIDILDESILFSTLVSIVKHCGETKALVKGRQVHAHINKYGFDQSTFVGNCLVQMYGDCGSLKDARAAFDSLPSLNLYSWNVLINAYAKNGHGKDALDLFHQMKIEGFKPDSYTFVGTLQACAGLGMLEETLNVHATIVSSGFFRELVVGNALIGVYAKYGWLCDARSVFDRMHTRSVVSWNAMIAACAHNGHGKEALEIFHLMQRDGFEPDEFTFVSVLDACASLTALKEGQGIHILVIEKGYFGGRIVGTALVNMYGDCGRFGDALNVFSQIRNRDLVSWNAMIAACANNGCDRIALDLFKQMQIDGFRPSQITFTCALDACASLAALGEGQTIHAAIVDTGFERTLTVGTALVNMYGKCGSFGDAKKVFDHMLQHDIVSWSAMIAACAQNGHCKEALDLFHQMELNGIKPDKTTYLSILTACDHAGYVDEGIQHFCSMIQVFGIPHTLEHCMCMVDLLGRAGHLADAEDLIYTTLFENNAAMWLCLLSACKMHGDVARGDRVANLILKLDPSNAAPYVMLSNICATTDRFDDAREREAYSD